MVNSEENMTNFKEAKTQVTVGYSRTLTEKNVAIGTAIIDGTENSITRRDHIRP